MSYSLRGDMGNSSAKMVLVNSEGVKRKLYQPSLITPIPSLPSYVEENVSKAVQELHSNMIVHIVSPGLKRAGLYAVGEKSDSIGNSTNMNIRIGNKYEHAIPVVMPLATIATQAVQDAYESTKEIPTDLKISATYATAIPAREFTPEIAKALEKRFAGTHLVTVFVSDQKTLVSIEFTKVKVTQEGVPAVYALAEGKEDLLKEYNEKYGVVMKNVGFRSRKLLFVDIGDGTTELIYIVNGRPVTDKCTGKRFGVGHAAAEAKKKFDSEMNLDIEMNRQHFMQAVRDSTHHYHNEAVDAIEFGNMQQSVKILEAITEMYATELQGNVDDIVVIGGGSSAFRSTLYEDLVDFTDSVRTRTLWVPEQYATTMNVDGLDILSDNVFFA